MEKEKSREIYMETTLWSSALQEIPVHWHGVLSVSFQLLRAFLVSFNTLLISSNAIPKTKTNPTKSTKQNKKEPKPIKERKKRHTTREESGLLPSGVRAREQLLKRLTTESSSKNKTTKPIWNLSMKMRGFPF